MQEVHLSKINLIIEKACITDIKEIGMTMVYTFNDKDKLTTLSYDKTNKFIIENNDLYLIKDNKRLLALKNENDDIHFIRNKVELDIKDYGNNLYLTKDENVKYIIDKGYSLCEFLLELEETTSEKYNYLIRKNKLL